MLSKAGLLALLVACTPPVAYRMDVAFSTSEQAEIRRAAAEWNAITTEDSQITEGDEWRVLKKVPQFNRNGECSRSKRTIWIHPEHPGATVYEVAVHEFGHALGLGHTTTGLMMGDVLSTEWTPEVLAECRKVGACK